MSLSQALNVALSGLKVTQTNTSVVANNIANAETPDFTRKELVRQATVAGNLQSGVRIVEVQRRLDEMVQRQLRTEISGGAYADTMAAFHARLDGLYGKPGGIDALDTIYNRFVDSAQQLQTSPETLVTRTTFLNEARTLTQKLNSLTDNVQLMRSEAESLINDAVGRVNAALNGIVKINKDIIGRGTGMDDPGTAALHDTRDKYISDLSQMMDVRIMPVQDGSINVFTNSGALLVAGTGSNLRFDARAELNPNLQWNIRSASRGVGTITLVTQGGDSIDLIADHGIRSGKLAALLEMRDRTLVQAQDQLDALAGNLARAMSDVAVSSTAATSGAQSGFDIDTTGLQPGNPISLTYTNVSTGIQQKLTLIGVSGAGVAALGNGFTPNTGDVVIQYDASGSMGSRITALQAALDAAGIGPALSVSNPSGSVMRFLNDGAGNTRTVDALSASRTETSLSGGSSAFPMFMDGLITPYSGSVDSFSPQQRGFAGRITVNQALIADPSKLVAYQTTPPVSAGDPTRPTFIHTQLSSARFTFPASTGIGSDTTPYSGTLGSFIRESVSFQGQASETASRLQQGQKVVVSSLRARFKEASGVNIDQEMAMLLQLQTAYGANARVLQVVQDMLDRLTRL